MMMSASGPMWSSTASALAAGGGSWIIPGDGSAAGRRDRAPPATMPGMCERGREPSLEPYRVSFVCLGNICRSPMAASVFRALVHDAELDDGVRIDSAGTGGWHVGDGADRRATAALRRRGYPLGH